MAYSAPEEDTNDADALFLRRKAEVIDDRRANSKWYVEARIDFGMYAGGEAQWDDADLDILKEENKPHATFNFIQPSVSAVNGMEVSNRQEVTFLPRTTQGNAAPAAMQAGAAMPGQMPGVPPQPQAPGANDQGPAEVLNAGVKYFRQECDAEDEESDAFQDDAICGMGWTETRVEFEDNPDGEMVVDRCDPLEMGWDSRATKRNLRDSRRFHRVRELDKTTAREMFPGFELDEIDATWARPQLVDEPSDREEAREYRNDQEGEHNRKTVTVVETTWIEKQITHEVANKSNGEVTRNVTTEQLKVLRERAEKLKIDIAVKKVTKKIYKMAFLGGTGILADTAKERREGTLCQSQKAFKFQPITGIRDRNKKQWMGLVRAMRDPQRWTNALYSSTLNSVMTSGKGIMAERSAFEKPDQAEADWSSNGKIVFMREGALSGPNPKVKEKVASQLPPGIDRLLEFALSALRGVSGVNLETLGGADREQAASLEYQRRQAATTILAPFFDGLRRHRKMQGRLEMDLARQYLSDGRLVRIVGPDYEGYVPFALDETVQEYDIIVAESPSSPNQKEAAWQTITQVLPMMGKNLSPTTGAIVLKASPLPLAIVKEFQDAAEQEAQAAAQQPNPEMLKLQGDMQMKQMDAEIKQRESEQSMAVTQQKAAADIRLKEMDIRLKEMELQLAAFTAQAQVQQTTLQAQNDREKMSMERENKQTEHAMKRESEGAKMQHDQRMREIDTTAATDKETAKSAGPSLPALAKGMEALGSGIKEGMSAQARAIDALAKATLAPRTTTLKTDGSGMPTGAVSQVSA
jgi:hypothetical protein